MLSGHRQWLNNRNEIDIRVASAAFEIRKYEIEMKEILQDGSRNERYGNIYAIEHTNDTNVRSSMAMASVVTPHVYV